MPTTDQAVTVKLELPEHVYETLSTWAASEIGCTAEDVLEALSEVARAVERDGERGLDATAL